MARSLVFFLPHALARPTASAPPGLLIDRLHGGGLDGGRALQREGRRALVLQSGRHPLLHQVKLPEDGIWAPMVVGRALFGEPGPWETFFWLDGIWSPLLGLGWIELIWFGLGIGLLDQPRVGSFVRCGHETPSGPVAEGWRWCHQPFRRRQSYRICIQMSFRACWKLINGADTEMDVPFISKDNLRATRQLRPHCTTSGHLPRSFSQQNWLRLSDAIGWKQPARDVDIEKQWEQ